MAMVSPSARTKEELLTGTSSSDNDDRGNLKNYEALNLVGTGAYGAVYKYVHSC